MPKYYLAIFRQATACALAAHLVVECCWFEYLPLPDDEGQIITRVPSGREPGQRKLLNDFKPLRFVVIDHHQRQEATPL